VTAVLAGLAIFGENLGSGAPLAFLHAGAIAAAALGAWWLSRAWASAAAAV
jgi:hypothetical protein